MWKASLENQMSSKKNQQIQSCPGLVEMCRFQKPVQVTYLGSSAGEILRDVVGRKDQERDSNKHRLLRSSRVQCWPEPRSRAVRRG